MGAIAVVKDIEFVDMLPKTRSGKIMRRAMKSLLMEEEPGDLSTIEEEASVDEIKEAVQKVKDGTKRKEGLKMTKVIEVTQGKVSGGGGIWEGGTYGS